MLYVAEQAVAHRAHARASRRRTRRARRCKVVLQPERVAELVRRKLPHLRHQSTPWGEYSHGHSRSRTRASARTGRRRVRTVRLTLHAIACAVHGPAARNAWARRAFVCAFARHAARPAARTRARTTSRIRRCASASPARSTASGVAVRFEYLPGAGGCCRGTAQGRLGRGCPVRALPVRRARVDGTGRRLSLAPTALAGSRALVVRTCARGMRDIRARVRVRGPAQAGGREACCATRGRVACAGARREQRLRDEERLAEPP
jgi:hypothetical protein